METKETTKKCVGCGRKIPIDAEICPYCKTSFAQLMTIDIPIEIRPGDVLADRYEIKRLLGSGGMGTVFQAYDKELEIDVALKFIPTPLLSDRRALETLRKEAQLTVKLTHENIVRVYDFKQHQTLRFIVMEYVQGKNLKQILEEKGKFSVEEAKTLLKGICEGLSYAHKNKIIHRDIKPANILLEENSNKPKIADFGIAREVKDTMTRVTGRTITGTLLYMAPECLRGEKPTVESDIYSLGATIYELLNGEPPFVRGDIYSQILREKPKPIKGIPNHINDVLLIALSKDPNKRFHNALDFYKAFAGEAKAKKKILPLKKKLLLPLTIISMCACFLIGLILFWPYNNRLNRTLNETITVKPKIEDKQHKKIDIDKPKTPIPEKKFDKKKEKEWHFVEVDEKPMFGISIRRDINKKINLLLTENQKIFWGTEAKRGFDWVLVGKGRFPVFELDDLGFPHFFFFDHRGLVYKRYLGAERWKEKVIVETDQGKFLNGSFQFERGKIYLCYALPNYIKIVIYDLNSESVKVEELKEAGWWPKIFVNGKSFFVLYIKDDVLKCAKKVDSKWATDILDTNVTFIEKVKNSFGVVYFTKNALKYTFPYAGEWLAEIIVRKAGLHYQCAAMKMEGDVQVLYSVDDAIFLAKRKFKKWQLKKLQEKRGWFCAIDRGALAFFDGSKIVIGRLK
ncbi:MAG: hypothetical protein DRP02_12565 [Candidatus Gerdarchaeota archaeon]|nr:MAG: hypothetical protein DRP02_12565 [Candidatus Gerdarchaeota archaeon]